MNIIFILIAINIIQVRWRR